MVVLVKILDRVVIKSRLTTPAAFTIDSSYLPLLLLAALGNDFLLDALLLDLLALRLDIFNSFVVRHGDCLFDCVQIYRIRCYKQYYCEINIMKFNA